VWARRISRAIPTDKQPDGVHLNIPNYNYVLQYIGHYLGK